VRPGGEGIARFRMPLIGARPVTTQIQILGAIAFVLLLLTGGLVFMDTTARTENSTYVTIASQMQYHTQRLAKAAGQAARGLQVAFPQVQDSRDEFANYLAILQTGGFAFGNNVPPGRAQRGTEEPPRGAGAALARVGERRHGDPRRAARPGLARGEHRADPRRLGRDGHAVAGTDGPHDAVGLAARAGAARQPPHVPRRAPGPRLRGDPGLGDHRPGGAVPDRQGHERPARPDPRARGGQRAARHHRDQGPRDQGQAHRS